MNNSENVSGNGYGSKNLKDINDQRLDAESVIDQNENEEDKKNFDSKNNDVEIDTTRVDGEEVNLDKSGPSESYDLGQKHAGSAAPTSTGGSGGAKPSQTTVGSVDRGDEEVWEKNAAGYDDVSPEVKSGTGAPRNLNTNRGTQDNDLRH